MIVRMVDAGHVFVTVAAAVGFWYGPLLFAGDAKVACHLQCLPDAQVNSLSLGASHAHFLASACCCFGVSSSHRVRPYSRAMDWLTASCWLLSGHVDGSAATGTLMWPLAPGLLCKDPVRRSCCYARFHRAEELEVRLGGRLCVGGMIFKATLLCAH